MPKLMRCLYCGTLQDEPSGAKTCGRCGGELEFVGPPTADEKGSYLQVQMELDQVKAPAGQNLERHLLITLRAPDKVPAAEAAPTVTGREPLSFQAVLDVSGSMSGAKIAQAVEAARQAVSRLHDGDTFSLVTFSNSVSTVVAPARVDDGLRQRARQALDKVQAGGQTALCGGLEEGLKHARSASTDTRLVLLLSDGQANVGETDLEKVGARAYEAHQAGVTVSTLGVGLDYAEALMVEIATQGGGRFYHVERPAQIVPYVAGELGEVAALAARNTQIHLDIPAGAILMPLSAAYSVQQEAGHAVVKVGDVPCDTELEIPVRLALAAGPAGSKLSVEGYVTYTSPADHELRSTLNRVTVRFVEPAQFQLRDGVVAPVAEKVLEQLKAANMIGFARARAKSPEEAEKLRVSDLGKLRAYASLLGDERAFAEAEESAALFRDIAASPMAAKLGISAAFQTQRRTKRFDK